MTRRRRLAMWILSWVAWLASPGCKEWAEGLEREANVIENDWAALRWALGSTRVLFDRREATIHSLDEVPDATQKFLNAAAWIFTGTAEKISVGAVVLSAILFGLTFVVKSTPPMDRAGSLLMLGAAIMYFFYWRYDWRDRINRSPMNFSYWNYDWRDRINRSPQPPLSSDPYECAHILRSMLRLYIDIQYGWVSIACLAVWFLGMFLPDLRTLPMGIILFGLIFFPMQMRADWLKRQRQIENLDALLAERDGVHNL
jgi:hypothetical protein